MKNPQMVSPNYIKKYTDPVCVFSGTTMANVNKELAEEELAEASRGEIQLHEVSRTTFLRVGFELEEQQ
jgi:hypothetical protein